jgi:carboxymethylenebutenolidase
LNYQPNGETMSEFVKLKAEDGHEFDAWVAKPQGDPIAGLVVIQEVFGVNRHIRAVTDGFARDGFFAVAPAIFDRVERGVDLGYEGADLEKGRSFFPKLNMDNILKDTAASLAYAREQTGKKAGVIGYCLGGSVAWLAATRLATDAAVGYYGGMISKHAEEQPRCPVMLHYGALDQHIGPEERGKVASAHPEVPIFVYEGANHGFNCDMRSAYNPEAAKLARERSLEFLKKNLT